MAAAIDAALQRGWHVECWHDVGTPLTSRPLDVPTIAWVPTFPNGNVKFREYRGATELAQLLRQKPVDAVVNLVPPQEEVVKCLPERSHRPLYVLMEPTPCDWCSHVKHPDALRQVDLFALTTPYWLEQDIQLLRDIAPFPFTTEMEADFRSKAIPVGWSQIDQLSLIDPNQVKEKWGIPKNKPVIAYLNWTDHSGYDCFREEMFQTTSWLKRIRVLLRYRQHWQTALEVIQENHIGHITTALRKFCDRNNAYLIVKYRNRDYKFLPEMQIADKVIFDEAYYPHTILELMSIANLSISYHSAGVRESIAAGVPHLVFDVAGVADQTAWGEKIPFGRQQSQPEGLWNYEGAVYLMNTEQILHKLPQLSIQNFQLDQKAQLEYYGKYLGIFKSYNSDNFIEAIQTLLKSNDCLPLPDKI